MSESDSYKVVVDLDAPIERVFTALSTPDGLRGWWGTDADVSQEVGGEIRFRWSRTSYVAFRIDRLQSPVEVQWVCIDQNDENLPHPEEWVGTSPSFSLGGHSGATRLSFVHHGLRPQLECFTTCESGWDHFLRHSLKPLVETGTGRPFDPVDEPTRG